MHQGYTYAYVLLLKATLVSVKESSSDHRPKIIPLGWWQWVKKRKSKKKRKVSQSGSMASKMVIFPACHTCIFLSHLLGHLFSSQSLEIVFKQLTSGICRFCNVVLLFFFFFFVCRLFLWGKSNNFMQMWNKAVCCWLLLFSIVQN